MKELILFLFVSIFIACQNQQLPKTALKTSIQTLDQAPTSAPLSTEVFALLSSETEVQKNFDLLEELQNPEKPGIYYREVVLRSEASSLQSESELVCLSDVTSFQDSEIEADTQAQALLPESVETPEDWAVLTERWELVQENLTCENVPVENPACQGDQVPFEQSNLLSSISTESLIAL